MKKVKKMKEMKIRKNYRNVWLEEERMKEQFPELVEFYSGSGWGEEDETTLNPYGFEFKKEKLVSFYSTNGDIAKIINRCAKAIKKIKINAYGDGIINGVEFLISKDAFRNSVNAFNTKYSPDENYSTGWDKVMTEEHKQKLVEGRKNGKENSTDKK